MTANNELTMKAREIARRLTYNDDTPQAEAKHMLLEMVHNAYMDKLLEAESLRNAIEAMRVAGGKDEFQAAFDRAKALLTPPNA